VCARQRSHDAARAKACARRAGRRVQAARLLAGEQRAPGARGGSAKLRNMRRRASSALLPRPPLRPSPARRARRVVLCSAARCWACAAASASLAPLLIVRVSLLSRARRCCAAPSPSGAPRALYALVTTCGHASGCRVRSYAPALRTLTAGRCRSGLTPALPRASPCSCAALRALATRRAHFRCARSLLRAWAPAAQRLSTLD
jgi:hypothetical protein